MNYYTFLRPGMEKYPNTDFESKLVELVMKVDRDFGSFREAYEAAFSLFEMAKENMPPEQVPHMLKLVGFFRLLADFSEENEDTYLDIQAELTSYITGNILEYENEIIFLDHKKFNEKYPGFPWNITETK